MTTKNKVSIFFKTLILSAVIGSSIAVTFLHEYYPKASEKYIAHKKNYKTIIKNRDFAFDNLIVDLKNNNISKEGYITSYTVIKKSSSKELKQYNKVKKEIKAQDSYLGYSSFKNFLLGIGFPISGMILSLLFLYIIINHVNSSFQKRFYLIVSFAFIASWGYWLSWSLLSFSLDPSRPFDFPKSYYNFALYVLPLLIFFASYYLIKHFKTIEIKLKSIINKLIVFIVKSDKYIDSKETKSTYFKAYMNEFEEIVK